MKLFLTTILAFFFCFFSYSQNLKIYHIDVDQADATLFISPNGSILLVDAGNNKQGDRIKNILKKEGKSQIDHFVLTHYHADHYGSIDEVYNDPDFTVDIAYDRGHKDNLSQKKKMQYSYIGYYTTVGKNAFALNPGMEILLDPTMKVTCISSNGNVVGDNFENETEDENDNSVSLLIEYGNFRYFVGGDIEKHTESKIAQKDLVLNVDVYQANHHGSHSSSSLNFMNDLLPGVIVISNGNTKRFGHPRKVTLNTYSNLNPKPVVYQTNKFLQDNSKAANVEDQFIADLDFVGDDGTILITVEKESYVVSYRGNNQIFEIEKSRKEKKKGLVIKSLLPDPKGIESENESIILKNYSTVSIDLSGYYFKDLEGKSWEIDEGKSIKPMEELVIIRNSKPMTLSNKGDIIKLFNASNELIDQVQYFKCKEGVIIETGH